MQGFPPLPRAKRTDKEAPWAREATEGRIPQLRWFPSQGFSDQPKRKQVSLMTWKREKQRHIIGYCLSLSKWSLNLDLQFLCISSSEGRDQPSEAITLEFSRIFVLVGVISFFVHIGISFSNCSILKKKEQEKREVVVVSVETIRCLCFTCDYGTFFVFVNFVFL